MWKKLLLVAGLLGCLTLPIFGGEVPQAAPDALVGKPSSPLFILTLDGKLVYHDGSGPQIPEWEPWIGPGLETGGSWFGLDFGDNKELLKRAEKLHGKKVRVTGRLEKRRLEGLISHQIDVLVVSNLQPVELAQQVSRVEIKGRLSQRLEVDDTPRVVKKTVLVEMRGRFLWRADHADILLPDSRLVVSGKSYVVNLGDDRKLWTAAACLDGHNAIVTGTLDGDTITATAIKPDADVVKKNVCRAHALMMSRTVCPLGIIGSTCSWYGTSTSRT